MSPDIKSAEPLGNLAYIITMSILVLRCLTPETPDVATINNNQLLTNQAFSLLLSSGLVAAFIIWLFSFFYRKPVTLIPAGWRVGLVLFVFSAAAGIFIASDKRAAVTDIYTHLSVILMFLMFTDLLKDRRRLGMTLVIIAAVGVVASFQCGVQFFSDNQQIVKSYESDPDTQLRMLNIEKGSLEHMMYEHRLYSEDIRGFLTTGNSTASFLLITFFCSLAMLIQLRGNSAGQAGVTARYVVLSAMVVILVGLGLTHSKGGIVSFVLCSAAFVIFLFFRKLIFRLRYVVAAFAAVVILAAVSWACMFGLKHGYLPGGNSMLVRWQYWTAAAKMFFDNPVFGVGGGNFAEYYTRYKIPAAPETVRDPHNFLLAWLTEYGLAGTLGLLAMIFAVLLRSLYKGTSGKASAADASVSEKFVKNKPAAITAVILVVLLAVRPLLYAVDISEEIAVNLFVYLWLFVSVALGFIFVFRFLLKVVEDAGFNEDISVFSAGAIFLAIAGTLLHNTIDFAIFEPALMMLFWIVLAMFAVMERRIRGVDLADVPQGFGGRFLTVFVIAVLLIVSFASAADPVAAGAEIQSAIKSRRVAHASLYEAAKIDKFSGRASQLNGKLYVEDYRISSQGNDFRRRILRKAEDCFLTAARRNPADFRNFESLTEVALEMSRIAESGLSDVFLRSSYDYALAAVERYPGSSKLRLKLAEICEMLGKNETALREYRKAVEIEDSYRRQFEVMYPQRELFWRLGEDNYRRAKERIRQLKALLE